MVTFLLNGMKPLKRTKVFYANINNNNFPVIPFYLKQNRKSAAAVREICRYSDPRHDGREYTSACISVTEKSWT